MYVGKLHAQECILDLWKVQQSRPKIKLFFLFPNHGQFFLRGGGLPVKGTRGGDLDDLNLFQS